PLAMLYRPGANAAAAERRGFFESPSGRLEVEEVRPMPEATVAVRRAGVGRVPPVQTLVGRL
ncbi:MAG: hypothetical protein ACKOHG_15970, partial [Planctomycetia bacterium]